MLPLLNNLPRKLVMESRRMKDLRSYDPRCRLSRLCGPTVVQLQTINRCNATCLMCPYSTISEDETPAVGMDDSLYLHILDEIRRAGTVRTLLLMLQNEPLLDRKLADRVRSARQLLGQGVTISTVTNGAPLTASMVDELATSGIDEVSVSIDAAREGTFNRIRRGLSFERVVNNTHQLIQRLGPRRVRVKFLRQRENEGEEIEFVDYWRRTGVTVSFTEPTNRAGTLDGYETIRKRRPDPLQRVVYPLLNRLVPACPLPFSSMSILSDGRAITCCNDWEPRDSLGSLAEQPLSDIWNGERINHYRHLLWTHRASESLVCSDCSLADRFWRT